MKTEHLGLPTEIKTSIAALSTNIELTATNTKGGNGYLFFGNHKILQRKIALKYYYWGIDTKFHTEPQQLSKIKSENIIEIHDAAQIQGGWAYFITPYYQNGDMDEWISAQGFPSTHESLNQVSSLLAGLSELHANRLVHRDLKPANIFISDSNRPLIGDFGSVRLIPEKTETIPGSGHAILYRPPESTNSGQYGFAGDLYQCGLILYQLLGGYFPYDELSWLTTSEKSEYDQTHDRFEKGRIADDALKNRILKGRIVTTASLPKIINGKIVKIIKKATNSDPLKRYKSCAEFMNEIFEIKKHTLNWRNIDGVWTTIASTSYRFHNLKGPVIVEKRFNSGWRRDKGFNGSSVENAIQYIDKS